MSRHYLTYAIVALILLGMSVLVGIAVIRALPGRYAYYLPEPLLELRRNPHPETLPTSLPTTPVPTSQPTSTPTDRPTDPPTDTPTPTPHVYIVEAGDTLSAIALRFDVPIDEVMAVNSLPNPDLLYVGQTIVIPAQSVAPVASLPVETPAVYTVQPGDTLSAIALRFDVPIDEVMAANSLTNPDVLYVGQTIVIPNHLATPTAGPPTETPTATALSESPPVSSTLSGGRTTPLPTLTPPPVYALSGVRHEHQGWNNCGPTTLAMALSYWGRDETQYDVAPVLKPDPEDKNVSLSEMESYTRDLGMGAIVRVGGTLERLKALVHAGFPVIVETWYVRDAHDQLGHYRLVIGYDDLAQELLTYDSLHGPDVIIGYQEMDELWRVFNRTYLVVYAPDRWEQVAAILGPDVDDVVMYEQALETARYEAAHPPTSCVAYADCADWVTFSWFTIGTNLTALGRHAEAAAAYDQARGMGLHYRMLWYQFGPYKSYYAAGRHDDVIALANATLATTDNLEESYYWRGLARLARGDTSGARADFEAALHYHADWPPAVMALEQMGAE